MVLEGCNICVGLGMVANLLNSIKEWFAGLWQAFLEYLQAFIEGFLSAVASLFPDVDDSGLEAYWNQIDYVFPLTEMIGIFHAVAAVWVVCVGVRLFRKHFPVVGG